MARYTPAFIAAVRHDIDHTTKTFAQIALERGISERTLNRMRDREGWTRRSERVRDVPAATRALEEATALLAARAGAQTSPLPPADPPLSGEGEEPSAPAPSPIERIEKLVERELAAEEAVRAQLGPLARAPADAERSARTLATLTQTLHALARLRGGAAPDQGSDDDDDIPADIDEFRRDLARRIDAFVAAETHGQDAQDDSRAAALDDAR